MELLDELDVEPGLLLKLAARGGRRALARLDESAGQRPAGRRVLPPDEHDAAVRHLRDDVDRGERTARRRAHCSARSRDRTLGSRAGALRAGGRSRPGRCTPPRTPASPGVLPFLRPEDALLRRTLALDRDRRLATGDGAHHDVQHVASALAVHDEVLEGHVARLGPDDAGRLIRLVDVPPEAAEDGLGDREASLGGRREHANELAIRSPGGRARRRNRCGDRRWSRGGRRALGAGDERAASRARVPRPRPRKEASWPWPSRAALEVVLDSSPTSTRSSEGSRAPPWRSIVIPKMSGDHVARGGATRRVPVPCESTASNPADTRFPRLMLPSQSWYVRPAGGCGRPDTTSVPPPDGLPQELSPRAGGRADGHQRDHARAGRGKRRSRIGARAEQSRRRRTIRGLAGQPAPGGGQPWTSRAPAPGGSRPWGAPAPGSASAPPGQGSPAAGSGARGVTARAAGGRSRCRSGSRIGRGGRWLGLGRC